MPPSQPAARINLLELKAKLSKILGPDKESQYFSIFSRFLSHRLSKTELDRQVVLTIGKENVALHNQLVKAILYNAAACSDPPLPPPPVTDTSKPVKGVLRRKPLTPSANSDEPFAAAQPRANGDAMLTSPRKNRTGIRKSKDRVDLLRPAQKLYDAAEQPDVDSATKRPRLVLPGHLDSPRESLKTSPSEEAVEELQECTLWNAWSVRPPLGTPFCVGSVGAAQRATSKRPGFHHHLTHSLLGDSIEDECLEASELPDGDGMRRRMEGIATFEQGLQGVSNECAHLLNQAVDVYLKRLISSSVEFVQSRRRKGEQQQHHMFQSSPSSASLAPAVAASPLDFRRDGVFPAASKLPAHGLNGVVWSGPSHHHLQSCGDNEQGGDRKHASVSVMDFRVAMEANPQLLGENRPLHLERILLRVFEQQQHRHCHQQQQQQQQLQNNQQHQHQHQHQHQQLLLQQQQEQLHPQQRQVLQ